MKFRWNFFAAALCAATCHAKPGDGAYARPDFDTYQPILDRMPFGAVPDPASSPVPVTADEIKAQRDKDMLARQINMSAVNIMPDGRTAIGFTDLAAKPPANYFLYVGASSDGWTVLEADYVEETAKITKDGIEIDLKIGKGLIEPAPAGPGRPALAAAALVNAAVPPGGPGPDRPLPPGLRRESAQPAVQSNVVGYTPQGLITPGAPAPSYSERNEARFKEEQRRKEETERRQKEMVERVAAAAAQNEILRREQEAAAAAQEEQADEDDLPVVN